MTTPWNLEDHDSAVALVQDDGRRLSYRQAARDADQVGALIGRPGRLIFLLCDNDIECVIAYLACLRCGAVPLMLSSGIDSGMLDEMLALYRPFAVWRKVKSSEDPAYGQYALARTHFEDGPQMHPELALLLATSGSTGSPKCVRLSRANIEANASSIAKYLGLSPEERPISVLPLHYSYGLSVLNSHLAVGATVLLTNHSVIRSDFWTFFREHAATSLSGVPYTYDMYSRLNLFKMELPSLRTLTQAGGRMAPGNVHKFAEWAAATGRKFFVMYGQTEATARMAYLPPEKTLEKPSSVGIAIPGGRFSLVDEEGLEIAKPGVDGQLIYHGPNVSLGYATCREDLVKGDENKGVLRTGDIARYDEEGYVYITGRVSRFIKIAGHRVGLDDVESVLRHHDVNAVCVGKDDRLCVAVSTAGDIDRARVVIDGVLHFHRSMCRIKHIPSIPVADSGKVLHHALMKAHFND